MPFPFSEICVFLTRLEDVELHDPPFLLAADKAARVKAVTESWFKSHRAAIDNLDVRESTALLSTLLPERRTDRVYGIREPRLCRILSRGFSLSATRSKDLAAYKHPGSGDLGQCLQRVLESGGPPAQPVVTLNEVDKMLHVLAGFSRFSDDSVERLLPGSSEVRDQLLGNIFKRLYPNEGKWLVRLILKDLAPVRIDDTLILKSFHFLLPDLLRFQDNFNSVIRLLKGPLREYPPNSDPRSQRLYRQGAAKLLKPELGVKVGRPAFRKARSIDHCIKMLNGQRWILERKYDGEYCEIHIDMTRSAIPSECITMFSKSGKNSTKDRQGLHQTLVDCLGLGSSECKIKRQAILLGELVVYSDHERRILAFEKIRKYVTRSGVALGTDEDSQQHAHEHLAIVFFDILVLNDEMITTKPLEERRMWLREVYSKIPGRAMSSEWKIVDFGDTQRSKKALIQQFAASNAERFEGLILKPCGQPYFALHTPGDGHTYDYIKLKKDYIAGMGDEADFAVVGASYSGSRALKSASTCIKWTDFHLGCLLNKADVLRFDARPRFKVVGTIQSEHCIPKPVLQASNLLGNLSAKPYTQWPETFDLEVGYGVKIDVIFNNPFVFEVLGSGFEKGSNCSFFMLRHARVKKLHQDRSWKDCVSFQELQQQAAASRAEPEGSESQETRKWIHRLEAKCKKKFERQRMSTPTTRTTETPSDISVDKTTNQQRNSAASTRKAHASTPTSNLPAIENTSALDGTTLINLPPSIRKRSREEDECDTRCKPAKRRYIGYNKAAGKESEHQMKTVPRNSSPLTDITNTEPRQHEAQTTTDAPTGLTEEQTISKRLSASSRPSGGAPGKGINTTTANPSPLTPCKNCSTSPCLLFNTTLYLAPCITTTPYITVDLLSLHTSATLVPSLAHWDRDSFSHAPLSETVSESQAYAGMRKIVLVESKRRRATEDVVREVLQLNGGGFRERVEVWDWRVLEDLGRGGRGVEDVTDRWLVGATEFGEERERAVFVRD